MQPGPDQPDPRFTAPMATPASTSRPRGAGMVGAGVLLVIAAVGWFLYSLIGGLLGVDDRLTTMPVPGEAIVEVEEPGDLKLYVQVRGGMPPPAVTLEQLDVQVRGPEGELAKLRGPGVSERYDINGTSGYLIGVAEVTEPGRHDITVEPARGGEAPFELAAGDVDIVGTILRTFAAGIPLLLGIVLIVIGVVRQAASRRRAAAMAMPMPPPAPSSRSDGW